MTVPRSAKSIATDWPPRIAAGDVAGLNAIYRRRGAIAFKFRGQANRLELAAHDDETVVEGPAFRIVFGGVRGIARVPAELVREIVRPLELRRPLEELEPDAAALLLDFAIEGEVARLERLLGAPAAIAARVDGPIAPGGQRVTLKFEGPDGSFPISLWIDRDGFAALGDALDRAARPLDDPMSALGAQVRVCMGWRELTVAQIKDLARGDVVLLEGGKEMAGPIAVAADRLATRLAVSSGRLTATATWTPVRGSFWEWCMEADKRGASDDVDVDDAAIDELPVKLIFELGRTEMSLGDVRRLGAGSVVPLARALDEAVDIMANGRRIGRGSIVRIGDAVGVRVERLTADE